MWLSFAAQKRIKHGNVSTEKEPIDTEMLAVAQAVKSSGGIVICQVEEITEVYGLHPRMVKVPGIYIDYIVRGGASGGCASDDGQVAQRGL